MKCSYSKEHGIFWAHLVRKEIEKAIVSQGKKLRNPRGCPQATVISCNCRIKNKTGLVSNILTALQCQRNNQLEIKNYTLRAGSTLKIIIHSKYLSVSGWLKSQA